MAYLACFSERHLADKIGSLSTILNNILATCAMHLLFKQDCQYSQLLFSKILSGPQLSVKHLEGAVGKIPHVKLNTDNQTIKPNIHLVNSWVFQVSYLREYGQFLWLFWPNSNLEKCMETTARPASGMPAQIRFLLEHLQPRALWERQSPAFPSCLLPPLCDLTWLSWGRCPSICPPMNSHCSFSTTVLNAYLVLSYTNTKLAVLSQLQRKWPSRWGHNSESQEVKKQYRWK